MGQQQGKTKKASSAAPRVPFPKRDDSAGMKAWARGKDESLYQTLLLNERIEQRSSVYLSGKRCGDDEYTLQQKLAELGRSILDKFEDLFEEDISRALQMADLSQLNVFDETQTKCKALIDQEWSKCAPEVPDSFM